MLRHKLNHKLPLLVQHRFEFEIDKTEISYCGLNVIQGTQCYAGTEMPYESLSHSIIRKPVTKEDSEEFYKMASTALGDLRESPSARTNSGRRDFIFLVNI